MPPFLEEALYWSRTTAAHFALMFWWVWLTAIVTTAVAEAFWVDRIRGRLLGRPADGWRTVGLATVLGILSPPSRRRVFRQAGELLAAGVSRGGVLAYLVSGQALLVWFLFAVVALNGPQLVLGQFLAVTATIGVIVPAAARMPESLWNRARGRARDEWSENGDDRGPLARSGPALPRLTKSVVGQGLSLAGPLAYGIIGIGFFLALGQSVAYVSLQGDLGPPVQAANAGVGVLLAYVSGAPLVGNAFFAAGLWKPEFVTYAGVSAFYLGTLVMPFALPRWLALFGVELGRRIVTRLVVAILVGALAATAWWWGLDAVAGALGVREAVDTFLGSTLRPNDVPWFHHWFAPGL